MPDLQCASSRAADVPQHTPLPLHPAAVQLVDVDVAAEYTHGDFVKAYFRLDEKYECTWRTIFTLDTRKQWRVRASQCALIAGKLTDEEAELIDKFSAFSVADRSKLTSMSPPRPQKVLALSRGKL